MTFINLYNDVITLVEHLQKDYLDLTTEEVTEWDVIEDYLKYLRPLRSQEVATGDCEIHFQIFIGAINHAHEELGEEHWGFYKDELNDKVRDELIDLLEENHDKLIESCYDTEERIPETLYHGTCKSRLDNIMKDGLRPSNATRRIHTEYAYDTEGFTSLSVDEHSARFFALACAEELKDNTAVVLSVDTTELDIPFIPVAHLDEMGGREYKTNRTIPPEVIEVETEIKL
jgi:CRISPR/Cas system-associated protein Cas10 (large subunit of type III CRISPR-Cas system)